MVREMLACVDEFVRLQGGPLAERLPTELTHKVLYTCEGTHTHKYQTHCVNAFVRARALSHTHTHTHTHAHTAA